MNRPTIIASYVSRRSHGGKIQNEELAGMDVTMVTGTYYRNLDSKGRVVITRSLREALGYEFVLTRAPGGCLMLVSEREWRKLARKNRDSAEFRDLLITGAVDVSPDPDTGRIQL